MRGALTGLIYIVCLAAAVPARAATGRVIKVLPQFVDSRGRNSLFPSLYERDAYQAYLRVHTNQIAGIQFVVQWKTKGPSAAPLTLRVEARGITHGNLPTDMSIEKPAVPGGWFGNWTSLFLLGDDYKNLGQVTAWRVTLWEGAQRLAEQKSFLWQSPIGGP
jgi:hypothetical protein